MKTRGRNICDTLKAIRKQIADANGIDCSPEECHFKGECSGTCPRCEQDLRDLEHELRLRQMAGKAIKVAGIAAGLVALTACSGGKQQRNDPNSITREPNIVKKEEPNPKNSQFGGAISLSGNNAKNVGEEIKGGETSNGHPTETMSHASSEDKTKSDQSGQSNQDQTAIDKSSNGTKSTYGPIMVGAINEKMPSFPGGFEALSQYLMDNVHYPEKCLKDSVTGKVIVGFTVTEDGSLSDIKVMRGVAPELDKEAVRVIKNMPKWNPGEREGKPTRTRYVVPIYFKIN